MEKRPKPNSTANPLGHPNPHDGSQIDGRAKATANAHLTAADNPPHKQKAHDTPTHNARQNDGTVPGVGEKKRDEVKDAHGRVMDDWTVVPPAPVVFQTTVSVSQSGSTTTLYTWQPLVAGDELEDLILLLQTAASTQTAETIAIALYASDNPINSVAAAQAGQIVVPVVTVPGDAESVSSTSNVFTFRALIPLLYRCALQGRYLGLVVTSGTDAISGYASLVPERHMRWYFPWGAPPTTAG